MVFFQDTRCLTEEVIDAWSEQAEQAYRKTAGKRAESTTKLRLSLEEILLRFVPATERIRSARSEAFDGSAASALNWLSPAHREIRYSLSRIWRFPTTFLPE